MRHVKADRVAARSLVWPKCVCVRGRPAVGVELQMSPFQPQFFYTLPREGGGGGRKSAASERGERKASIVRPRRRSQKAPSPPSLPRGAAESGRSMQTHAHAHRQRQKQESRSQGSRPSSKLLTLADLPLAASPVRRAF